LFEEICSKLAVRATLSLTYNAKSNMVERMHLSPGMLLKVATQGGWYDWEEVLPSVLLNTSEVKMDKASI